MSFIEFENVTFSYESTHILKDFSLGIETNSFWGIIGPNGAGKSTFLSLLSGQLEPKRGNVYIDRKPVSQFHPTQRAQMISLVRQEFIPVFGYSVYQTVMMGRYARQQGFLFENTNDRKAVDAAMEATDTLNFAQRSLGHLSGGERQRVFIARALAQQTPILLLDEPTSHLDLKHQVRIFDLLKQMQCQQGKTILLVTHDINLAGQYCDRILLLGSQGAFFEGSPQNILKSGQIQSVFGVQGYHSRINNEYFFLPLGRFSKDQPEYSEDSAESH